MRSLALACGLIALLAQTGCTGSKWAFLRNGQETSRLTAEVPTATQLVDYLNQNSQRLQAIHCQQIDMDLRGPQSVGLQAWMVCQKGRNFRLQGEVLGKTAVDIGSNDQEFWYWVSRAEPPYLVHCSYQDLARGVRIPFPFQPEWVMETLGMGQYGPPEQYKVVPRQQTLDLVQETANPQGQRLYKVTVFNRGSTRIQVPAYVLQDANHKEICAAHIQEVQLVDGVVVPRKIVLVWPAEHIELKMKLDEVTINRPIDANWAATLFTRPVLPNVQSYDLARGLDAPANQLRPAGAFVPSK